MNDDFSTLLSGGVGNLLSVIELSIKTPFVSVLIPTYNCAKWISQAIDSILAQDYPNLEIIVVDDGSTDDTATIVERIVETRYSASLPNVVQYFHKPHSGISASRNLALEKATGELIAWCDADDFWAKGKLKAQVDYLEKHPECQIVFTRYANVLEYEKLGERHDVQHEIEYEKKIFTHLTSALIKREVFTRIGNFRENLIKGEDSDWIFRLSVDSAKSELYIDGILPNLQYIDKGLFSCLYGIYYFRRLHGDNITLADSSDNGNLFLNIVSTNLREKIKRFAQNIPVFIASDNNFAPLLAVAIYSILRNTKSHINFYILDGGISAENKAKIETLKTCFSHFSLEFIAIDVDAHFRDFKTTQAITLSMYSHLLIPQLKLELDKAIYLDADIIAMDNIAELWNESLDDYPLGAVWAASVDDAQHNGRLGVSNNHKYFNSGVLLINCKKWRENHIVEELFALESKVRNKLIVPDQDLLNIYFDGKVKILPSKYNTTTRIVLFDRILKNDTGKIVVRHFESAEKPHNSHYYGCYRMPHFEEFWDYACFTPFLEMLPKNHKIQTNPDLSKFRKTIQKPPLVSVLIPTCNYAQYIGQCIESILAQNYPNLEIIVVDDGSTDNTADVVGALRATPLRNIIRYFYKENGGIGSAQNECLKHARGKYIAWADADDYWLAGKLQAQLKYFAENPDCEIVFTLWEYNLENEKLKDNPLVQYEISLQQTNMVLFPSSLALKSVYDRCGAFNTEMQIGSDSEMLSKMIVNNIKLNNLIPVALYHRRLHSTNASFIYNKENPEAKTLQYMIKNLRNRHAIAK
ncbi:hypothetical protein FACS1894182_01660 [Bacteroidia bacterium]|nr:hypothetical protein FACS1894182_01660 [Bacteroidia bacterium]